MNSKPQTQPTTQTSSLELGFFSRLFTPSKEKNFIEGIKSFIKGEEESALTIFLKDFETADSAFMAGFMALQQNKSLDSLRAFQEADSRQSDLGNLFQKYGLNLELSMSITEELTIMVQPDRVGLMLGLVEAYQLEKRFTDAVKVLKELSKIKPEDPVIKVSLAELLFEAGADKPPILKEIVKICQGLENESFIHATAMFYQARALEKLGLDDAALSILTSALRKKKDRPDSLLATLYWQRGQLLEKMGKNSRDQKDFQKIYLIDSEFEGLSEKITILNNT